MPNIMMRRDQNDYGGGQGGLIIIYLIERLKKQLYEVLALYKSTNIIAHTSIYYLN